MKKKIYLILTFVFLFICLTGCFNKNKKTNEQLTLEYLSNSYSNYNDTFTYINCGYDLFGSNQKCYYKSKKYNDEITIYITKENNNYSFEDNYFKLYMRDNANQYFYDISNKYIESSVKVRFDNLTLPSGLNNESSFLDLVNNQKSNISVYFISKNTFSQTQIDSILNEIQSNKIMGNFKFIQTNDNNLLNDYSISDIVNNYSELIILEQNYEINSNFKINKIN